MDAADVKAIGVIGLGKMGAGFAAHAMSRGLSVVGTDHHPPSPDLLRRGLRSASDVSDLARQMPPRRVIFLYVPAGSIVDDVLNELCPHLQPGDIIADGGNSYWGDSIRRHARLKEKGIAFVDLGTSGGRGGAKDGACFMVGGDAEAVALLEPMLQPLAVEGGYVHAGPAGAGHYVKLVHNGIEFGMLQAIGEGVDLLERYHETLPIAAVLECWRHGSVIRSWLIDLMSAMYKDRGGLSSVPDYVEDTGEVNWLVEDAMRMEVPIPVITQSVVQLIASRDRAHNSARAIAMMRHGFGGHPYGPDEGVARERHTGRVGGFVVAKKE